MLVKYLTFIPLTFCALVVEFFLCAFLLLLFATRLSKFADALEKKTEVSALWIGMIFLAIVTSIPEAVASIGSVLMEGALDLGAGNLFGSCAFNLAIIVILDVIQGAGPLLLTVQGGLVLGAAGGILLMTITVMAIAFHHLPGMETAAGWIGIGFSVLIAGGYIALSRLTSEEMPDDAGDSVAEEQKEDLYAYTRPQIYRGLALFSALLILDAVWLLRICDLMAITPIHVGSMEIVLGRTVTGTFILSIATSLPELFVSLAAFRLGQTNMSIANLLGSNMVNLLFLPIMHAVAGLGPIYAEIDAASIIVLCTAILMSGLFIVGLRVRSKQSFLYLGWEVICMLGVYIAGAFLVIKTGLTF